MRGNKQFTNTTFTKRVDHEAGNTIFHMKTNWRG